MILCETNPCGLEDCPYIYSDEQINCEDCNINKGGEDE